MIISDLNYLEVANEEVVGGFTFTATKNVGISIGITENTSIIKNFVSNVSVTGNSATAEGQATASGNNTFTQVFSFTDTTGNSSASNSFSVSVTGG